MEQWIIIRDNKPQVPWRNPNRKTRIVSNWQEHNMALRKKIDEEIAELEVAHQSWDKESLIEECADIYEVALCMCYSRIGICLFYPKINHILSHYDDITEDRIRLKAQEKRQTHGSFQEWILLDLATVLVDEQ